MDSEGFHTELAYSSCDLNRALDKPRTYVWLQKFINRNRQQKFSWQSWWHFLA